MKGAHDIYIMKVNDEYRVRPSVWSTNAAANAKVMFRNLTNWKVMVLLPDKVITDPNLSTITLKPVGAADKTDRDDRDVKKRFNGDPGEQYPYSVIVMTDKGAVAAIGESDPIIIIDPPPLP